MSAAQWERLVKEWDATGENADFPAKKGVSESGLRWWKGELARRARAAAPNRSPRRSPRVTMARVVREGERIPPSEARAEGGELVVHVGAVRIVVERGFDASLLRAVVHALGGGA